MTIFYLLAGTTSFPNPGNWNLTNTVELLGAGGNGRAASGATGGTGGGGGGYVKALNVDARFPVATYIGSTGIAGAATTWLSYYTGPEQGPQLSAFDGRPGGNGSTGGSFACDLNNCSGFTGGGGATAGGTSVGKAGGGAAGLHGDGAIGSGTTGGTGDAGNTPGGITSNRSPAGTQWDATHGSGGGGFGSNASATPAGSPGGNYGGGGGGSYGSGTNAAGGAGTPGLIVITYIPIVLPKGGGVVIMA